MSPEADVLIGLIIDGFEGEDQAVIAQKVKDLAPLLQAEQETKQLGIVVAGVGNLWLQCIEALAVHQKTGQI